LATNLIDGKDTGMETKDELMSTVERLTVAANAMEQALEKMAQRQHELQEATIGRVIATVDVGLEERLAVAEAQIAELKATAGAGSASVTNGRKTLPVTMVNLLAKQGVSIDSMEAGALDAALASLSLEQRIAVKAQLVRAGLLG
jgi:hypothetical protein